MQGEQGYLVERPERDYNPLQKIDFGDLGLDELEQLDQKVQKSRQYILDLLSKNRQQKVDGVTLKQKLKYRQGGRYSANTSPTHGSRKLKTMLKFKDFSKPRTNNRGIEAILSKYQSSPKKNDSNQESYFNATSKGFNSREYYPSSRRDMSAYSRRRLSTTNGQLVTKNEAQMGQRSSRGLHTNITRRCPKNSRIVKLTHLLQGHGILNSPKKPNQSPSNFDSSYFVYKNKKSRENSKNPFDYQGLLSGRTSNISQSSKDRNKNHYKKQSIQMDNFQSRYSFKPKIKLLKTLNNSSNDVKQSKRDRKSSSSIKNGVSHHISKFSLTNTATKDSQSISNCQTIELNTINNNNYLQKLGTLENTMVYKIAMTNNWFLVAKLVQKRPEYLHKLTSSGDSLLHLVVQNGNLQVVKSVMRYADKFMVLRSNLNGQTPISLAAGCGNKDIQQYLLSLLPKCSQQT